jgi:hypothetical protein
MKPRLSGAFPLAALMGEIGPMGLGDNASCLTIGLFIIVKGEEEGIERWSHAVLSRCGFLLASMSMSSSTRRGGT